MRKSTPSWQQSLSRREFLASAAAIGAAAVFARAAESLPQVGALAAPATRPAAGESVAVIVHNERVVVGLQVRAKFLREMIDEAVIRLSGADNLKSAWGRFITPGQKVLLKFAQPLGTLSTETPMLTLLLQSMEEAGHKRADITVADGPSSAFAEHVAIAGRGWSSQSVSLFGRQETLRKYLDGVEAIVNVPFICHHNTLGISCAMTNMTLPFIRHPSRYDERVDEAVVALYAMPELRRLTKVTIVNAIYGSFDGGPAITPTCLASDRSVWASADAVALDRLALEWVQRQRRLHSLLPLSEQGAFPRYINLASGRGLGQDDLRLIRRETLTL